MNPHAIEVVEALLDSDEFIMFSKTVATILGGADEALIIKKIHDWCKRNRKKKSAKHFHDGWYWTYNTYQEWHKEFPWMSPRTIQRKMIKLEKLAVITTARHRANQNDQTKWYRVNMETLYQLRSDYLAQSTSQDDAIDNANMACSGEGQVGMIDSANVARSTSRQSGTISFNKETRAPHESVANAAIGSERLGRSTPSAATKQKQKDQPPNTSDREPIGVNALHPESEPTIQTATDPTTAVGLVEPRREDLPPPQPKPVTSPHNLAGMVWQMEVTLRSGQKGVTEMRSCTEADIPLLSSGELVWFGLNDGTVRPYIFRETMQDEEAGELLICGECCLPEPGIVDLVAIYMDNLFLMHKRDKQAIQTLMQKDKDLHPQRA